MTLTEYKNLLNEINENGGSHYLSIQNHLYNAKIGEFQTFRNSQGDTVDAGEFAMLYHNHCVPDDTIFAYNTNNGLSLIDFENKTESKVNKNILKTIITKYPIRWYSGTKMVKDDNGEESIEFIESQPIDGVFESLCQLPASKLKYIPEYSTTHPGVILTEDGNVISSKGYCGDYKIVLMNNFSTPIIPEHPTYDDVCNYKDKIYEIVKDFKFKRDIGKDLENSVSFQNYVFSLFLAAFRPIYDGPMPIIVINKNSERVGGTLLHQTIGALAHGVVPGIVTFNTKPEENEKITVSKVIESPLMAIIDNVTQESEWVCPTLLSATSCGKGNTIEVRPLQTSKMKRTKPNTIWGVNGINIGISADVCGRVVVIDMETNKSWQNLEFRETKDSLLKRCVAIHPEIISGLATMIRYWIDQGKPPAKTPNGNFSEYAELYDLIAGVMNCCGYNCVLENMKDVQTLNNSKDTLGSDVINILFQMFGSNIFRTQDIIKKLYFEIMDRISTNHDLEMELADKILESNDINRIKSNTMSASTIGTRLSKFVDVPFSGTDYKLTKGRDNKSNFYRIVSQSGESIDMTDTPFEENFDVVSKKQSVLQF